MKIISSVAMAAAGSAILGVAARGEIVETIYEVGPNPDTSRSSGNSFMPQAVSGYDSLGEDIHLATSRQIGKVSLVFGFQTYDPGSYTPNIVLNLYDVNSSGLPIDSNTTDSVAFTPIATVARNDVTFTGSNYNNGGFTSDTRQTVTFDFSAKNIVRKDFAIAWFNALPEPDYIAAGISVFVSDADPSVGSTNFGELYEQDGQFHVTQNNTFLAPGYGYPIHFEATITSAPEPASMGILAIGALAALRRRRRST